jgi:hypothetical protein
MLTQGRNVNRVVYSLGEATLKGIYSLENLMVAATFLPEGNL